MATQQPAAGVPREEQAAAFRRAAEGAIAHTELYRESVVLAGMQLNLRFAGKVLRDRMMRAFALVCGEGGETPLEVTIWDSASSGVALPAELGNVYGHMARGLGQVRADDQYLFHYDDDAGSFNILDRKNKKAIFWAPDVNALSERHRAAPLQTLITWWLPMHERPVVHAAAVGTEDGAVLLCGPSGSGKSTTALSCLTAGFRYLSDDLCALTIDDAGVTAHSLFCTGKVFEHHLQDFPDFDRVITNRVHLQTEKAIAYLPDWPEAKVGGSLPLRAVVMPVDKVDGPPVIRRVTAIKILLAIGPITLSSFPGIGRDGLAGHAAFLNRVPSYEMQLSRDITLNPIALRQLIENPTSI